MKTTIKPILVTLLLLSSTLIFSQNPGDPPVDPGVSPINDYIVPMMALGMALGYRLLKKKTQEV
jgi:hypothetical protein